MKTLEEKAIDYTKTAIVFKRSIPDQFKPYVRGMLVEFAQQAVNSALQEATKEIEDYIASLENDPKNKVYQENKLIILETFIIAVKIMDKQTIPLQIKP